MIVKIDVRESELLKKCQELVSSNPKFKAINIVSESLPLGDIIINDGENDCAGVSVPVIHDNDTAIPFSS